MLHLIDATVVGCPVHCTCEVRRMTSIYVMLHCGRPRVRTYSNSSSIGGCTKLTTICASFATCTSIIRMNRHLMA